jgi:hypothetical protein
MLLVHGREKFVNQERKLFAMVQSGLGRLAAPRRLYLLRENLLSHIRWDWIVNKYYWRSVANRQVTPEEMLIEWAKIIQKARPGAKAAADAMAKYIAWRAAEITLRRTLHPPGAYNQQRSGEPPAYASGTLAKAMFVRSAHEAIRATALVGNKAPYSRITELGCVVDATNDTQMHWDDSAGHWYHWQLEHPAHPFLAPTTQEAMDDGSLQEVAVEAFIEYDP